MENLPPGFRFYPTEEELVSFYLHHKLEGKKEDLNRVMDRVIPILDIYEFNPWDLPRFSGEICNRDPEQWFFFIPRQESEARGGRPRRLTTCGYWKATGSPGYVYSSDSRTIGLKRTMVFYNGRAPSGKKTEWKMNEYKAIIEGQPSSSSTSAIPTLRQEFSLCRLYKKSKCLRAFDRRPPPGGVIIGKPRVVHQQLGATLTNSVENPHQRSISSPSDSSSSGDHTNPFQNDEENNNNNKNNTTPMEEDHNNEGFWDLEQFDWFQGMH